MRGRKPKPTAIKKRAGNPGRHKLNQAEVKPKTTATLKPALIDARAKEFSDRLLPELRALGIATDIDLASFELMATHYAIARLAAETIKREGLIVEYEWGKVKHPLLQIWRDNSKSFLQYAIEFGLSPSARSRIHVNEPEQLSLAELLFAEAPA